MEIAIQELSIVAVIGNDEDEKRNFLMMHFKKDEIFSMPEEEKMAEQRLKADGLVVIEVAQGKEDIYEKIIRVGRRQHALAVAIFFSEDDQSEESMSNEAVEKQLRKKGFNEVYVIDVKDRLRQLEVVRTKLAINKRELHGPFDIIGDVHGCYDELCILLAKLGYEVDVLEHSASSQEGRMVVFCGDLVDRGPKVVDVLKLVMNMVKNGTALSVLGNHDGKLQRKLRGADVQVIHGLEKTMAQLEQETEVFRVKVLDFLDGLVSHYVLDGGRLVVAHAGLKERLHGRESKKIRDLAMFGETTGELDAFGLPVRLDWSEHYTGEALVVYGHTPRAEARMRNCTINIDTGCVYGGKLTAFRYPEQVVVDVEAKMTYYEAVGANQKSDKILSKK